MGKALEQRAPRHRRDRSQSPGEADVMLSVSGFGYPHSSAQRGLL